CGAVARYARHLNGAGRNAPPPASQGKSEHLGIMPAGGVAYAGKLGHVRIDAAPRPERSDRVATHMAADYQRLRIIRVAPDQLDRDRIGQSFRVELQVAGGEPAVLVAKTQDGPSA